LIQVLVRVEKVNEQVVVCVLERLFKQILDVRFQIVERLSQQEQRALHLVQRRCHSLVFNILNSQDGLYFIKSRMPTRDTHIKNDAFLCEIFFLSSCLVFDLIFFCIIFCCFILIFARFEIV
jgi:hypothetical protein